MYMKYLSARTIAQTLKAHSLWCLQTVERLSLLLPKVRGVTTERKKQLNFNRRKVKEFY